MSEYGLQLGKAMRDDRSIGWIFREGLSRFLRTSFQSSLSIHKVLQVWDDNLSSFLGFELP